MERAPFGWSQPPVERDEDLPLHIDRPMPSGRPAFEQPYIWASPPKARPRFRYVDDTPKMGRLGSAAFLGFLVLLAFGAVWVIEQDFNGSPATAEPPKEAAALEPPAEIPVSSLAGAPDVAADQPDESRVVQTGGANEIATQESAALSDQQVDDVRTTREEPPPVIGTHEPPPDSTPTETTPAPRPVRRDGNVNAGVRPRAVPPPAQRVPFPTSPPLSQQVMRTPPVEPAPSPAPAVAPSPAPAAAAPPAARVAAAESVPTPLPRVAIDDPVVTPAVTPPIPEPAPTAASSASPAPAPPSTVTASAAPSAAGGSAAARPVAADVDNSAIRDVLGRYRSAFNALDAKAAHQVWPTVNERSLDRAFGQLQQQNVSFDRCTIAVKGVIAQANCNGTTRFVPRVGNRSEQVEARQWNFSLRKAYSGGWVIQEVQAR